MFEAYSSREHQSAVERLIQLATGKKSSAPVMEEEPAVSEAAEPLGEQAEPVAESPQQQAADNAAPESASAESWVAEAVQAVEGFVGEHPLHEEQAEPRHEEAAPVEADTEAQASVEEPAPEAVAEPVTEPAVEPSVESAADEVHEHAVETASAEESASAAHEEPHHEPHDVLDSEAHEHDFHEEAVEPALVESVLAEHDADVHNEPAHEAEVAAAAVQPEVAESEPVAEHASESELNMEPETGLEPEAAHEPAAAAETPAVEEAASEQASPEQAGDEHAHQEAPVEPPIEEAPTDASDEPAATGHSTTEVPEPEVVAEPVQAAVAASAGMEAEASQKVEEDGTAEHPAAEAEGSSTPEFYYAASNSGDGKEEPYRLEKYMRRSLYRRTGSPAGALDVVPSPDETMFLKSKDLSEQPTEEELKELARDPMWKTLMQFKGWLPLVTRVLPLLDLAGNRGAQGMNREVKESVDGLTVSQRELRVTLQDQTLELKRVEEEVSRLRDTAEKTAFDQTVTADEVKALRRLLKNVFLYVGILLGLLVVAVGYMAFLVFTYLNTPTH